MLTGAQIALQASQDAKVPNYTVSTLNKLQTILDELCLKHSFATARGVYYFPLNPAAMTTIAGFPNFSGPYPLPLDYLRTSETTGSEGVQYAFFYVFNGVPYPMVPWDLGMLDVQVQYPNTNVFPSAFATDMSPETTAADYIAGGTTCSTTLGSTTINVASPNLMQVGQAISGNGIATASTIVGIGTVGQNSTPVTLSLPATGTFINVSGAGSASVMFGVAPNMYIYPGPSFAFPATLRYQRLMPPLLDLERVPWFPDQSYLIERLTADLMATTSDDRRQAFLQHAAAKLGAYESFEGDKTNRAQKVIMDRNRFGRSFNQQKITKVAGW